MGSLGMTCSFEVTPFQFPCGGALGHIASSCGLSVTTGEQEVSPMGPRCKVSACTAWGKWGTLIAPPLG